MEAALFGAAFVLYMASAAANWAVSYQLIKQNGRLLQRLDALEQRPGAPLSLRESHLVRDGLPAGTPAPLFVLPTISGGTLSLTDFRGRQVLLVFSDPQCGPCDAIAPYLVRLHNEHVMNGLSILMVGRGEPDANRRKADQHGFAFPVAIQRRWEISMRYGIFATPVAFLIGKDGVIVRNVAKGMDEIVTLVRDQALAGNN
jgi:peroxiredoxin